MNNTKDSKNKSITSVTEYLERIFHLKENEKKHSQGNVVNLFRGVKDSCYELEPSIYRKNKETKEFLYLEKEDYITKETLASMPHEFKDMKYTVEKLIKMQHYGIPTRLLDVTANALAALFFACEECKICYRVKQKSYNTNKTLPRTRSNNNIRLRSKVANGKVFFFTVPQAEIKFCDSDSVSVLANLCLVKKQDKKEFITTIKKKIFDLILKLKEIFKNLPNNQSIITMGETVDKIHEKLNENSSQSDYAKLKNLITQFDNKFLIYNSIGESILFLEDIFEKFDNLSDDLPDNVSNDYKTFRTNETINITCKLPDYVNNIQKEKPHFQDKIHIKTFITPIFLRPYINNNRIAKQDGYFILFGMDTSKNNLPEVSKELYSKIIIDSESKKNILNELAMLGITKKSLFPELDIFAEYIKEDCTKNK